MKKSGPIYVYVFFPLALALAPIWPDTHAAKPSPAPESTLSTNSLSEAPPSLPIKRPTRPALFPELARFPQSFAEVSSSTIAVVLPRSRRDVHLRAAGVVAARFGQSTALGPERLELIEVGTHPLALDRRSGILVGLRSEIASALPAELANKLPRPFAGQGLLAEFICGSFPKQQRWLVVSGADDEGLDKAILTLGCADALGAVAPSPAIITDDPRLHEIRQAEAGPAAPRILRLDQLPDLLVRDPFLRQGALAVPANATLDQLRTLLTLAWQAGHVTTGAGTAWLNAFAYAPNRPLPRSELLNRSVLILGSAAQWPAAAGAELTLAIHSLPAENQLVRVQGRAHRRDEFEPEVALFQLCTSPWACTETVVFAGGWNHWASPMVEQLMTKRPLASHLGGNLAAMDLRGRTAKYDTAKASVHSFAETLAQRIPPGLTPAETRVRLAAADVVRSDVGKSNWLTMLVAGLVVLAVAGARAWFIWGDPRPGSRTAPASLAPAPEL